jgi:trans-2-enoyl-CoA reductase
MTLCSRTAWQHYSPLLSQRRAMHLCYNCHGDPLQVLRLKKKKKDEGAPLGPQEVRLRILAAAINPADINQIEGRYPLLPSSLPAVPGNEATAQVLEVGSAVAALKAGSWCVPVSAGGGGMWRSTWRGPAASWMALPAGVPLDAAATLTVSSCTALRMLEDFVRLKPGDAVVQNAGSSAVSRAVTQIARAKDLHSVSLLRRRGTPEADDALRAEILALGADLALFEDELRDSDVKPRLREMNFRLGLNSVGGVSAENVAKLLAPKASFVTYGGMSKGPATIPTGLFIFKDISARGFWMTRWMNEVGTTEDKKRMLLALSDLARSGTLHSTVKLFDLETEWRQAVEMAVANHKPAKAVLRCGNASGGVAAISP